MTDQRERSTSRRRAEIISTAVALVETDGIDGLSMRRLAARLGVTPMALYNHVTDKNDLITGIVDHILNGIRLPAPDASWQWRLRGVFTGLRQLYLDHPDLVPLIQASTTISAAQLRPLEAAFEALVDAGLSLARAREAWTALISLTNGHVAYQLRGHFTRTDASTQGAIESAGDFPRLTAALTLTPSFDHDSAFETALDALIHGLTDKRVAEPAERRP